MNVKRGLRSNSPQATARVLAALLTEDGLLSPQELDFMDRLGIYGIVGVSRDEFMRAVASQVAASAPGARDWPEAGVTRSERLDGALDAINDRDQQLLICAVMMYLAEADQGVNDTERALICHVLERWSIGAVELERELNVPQHRTSAFCNETGSGRRP